MTLADGADELTAGIVSQQSAGIGIMTEANEKNVPRQYHYFYGSTGASNDNSTAHTSHPPVDNNGTEQQQQQHTSSPSNGFSGTDENSLVGEELVHTDNELDDGGDDGIINDTMNGNGMVVLSNGNGDEMQPLMFYKKNGIPDGEKNGTLPQQQHRTHHHHHHIPSRQSNGNLSQSSSSFMLHHRECCEDRPWIRQLFVLMTCVMILFIATVIFFPGSHVASVVETRESDLFHYTIPFRIVDRGVDYDDPVTNFIDLSLFHPSLLEAPLVVPQSDVEEVQPQQQQDGSDSSSTNTNKVDVGRTKQKGPRDTRTFTFPFPTGAFWTNLVLPPTADRGLSYPIAVYPYAYKWSLSQLQVSYPAQHRVEDAKAIHDYFFPDVTFDTVEEMVRRNIVSFDSLSVSLRYYSTDNVDDNDRLISEDVLIGGWETYLVQGSPYVTMKYALVTPIIQAFSTFTSVVCPRDGSDDDESSHANSTSTNATTTTNSHPQPGPDRRRARARKRRSMKIGVCSSSRDTKNQQVTLTGIQFILGTPEGMNWIVFASEPVTITFDTIEKNKIIFGSVFNGILRVALIPSSSNVFGDNESSNSNPKTTTSAATDTTSTTTTDTRIVQSSGLERLIYHAGVYPTSGSVSWSFRSASNVDTAPVQLTASQIVKQALSIAVQGIDGASTTSSASRQSNPFTTTTRSSFSSSSNTPKSGRIATLAFRFETDRTMSAGSAPKPLLMLALPHHAQSLDPSVQLSHDVFDLVYKCIKGPMRPVLGSTWMYDEPLLSIGFDGGSGSNSHQEYLRPEVRSKILENLRQDVKLALPVLTENIYGFGKQAARLAQLAYIASVLERGNSTTTKTANMNTNPAPLGKEDAEILTLQQEALKVLKDLMISLLRDKTSDALVYDANLGGLVTSDGLLDSHADFGNGRYNDHHFHYGYLLYACAILGKLDPAFAEEYSDQVDAIYFDIAHDSNFDSKDHGDSAFFPGSRHKVWFDGHSFASGMFPFGNGKSQESSSEAVNAYYGAYLWSLVRSGAADNPDSDVTARTDFARLLLATEIRGAKTYWHMIPPASSSSDDAKQGGSKNQTDAATVYTPQFSKNYMVGNLGMLDAICTTWFGTESLYVHMINLIPVTAVTGELFGEKYAALEYKDILEPLGSVENAWNGFIIADRAISDPLSAWKEALELYSPTLDAGLSKTQILYWISTRQGFNASAFDSSSSDDNQSIDHSRVSSLSVDREMDLPNSSPGQTYAAACKSSPSCAATGLTGDCCPTVGGIFLSCCER